MRLTDFDQNNIPAKALQENYHVSFDVSKLSIVETKTMLTKVRSLANEAKQDNKFYVESSKPSYMKLVFMEQALVAHYNDLISRPQPRIVVENEEVEKSQVVLAAQDMVDSIQKMIEDVSDMLVKELPALVNSIQSEIGVTESETFNTQATEALSSLQATLTQSKTSMQTALNGITGAGGPADFETPDMGGEEEVDISADEIEAPMDEPMAEPDLGTDDSEELAPLGGAGREKR